MSSKSSAASRSTLRDESAMSPTLPSPPPQPPGRAARGAQHPGCGEDRVLATAACPGPGRPRYTPLPVLSLPSACPARPADGQGTARPGRQGGTTRRDDKEGRQGGDAMVTAIPVQRGKPRLGLVAGLVAAARGLAFAGLMLAELGLLAVLLAAVGLTAL